MFNIDYSGNTSMFAYSVFQMWIFQMWKERIEIGITNWNQDIIKSVYTLGSFDVASVYSILFVSSSYTVTLVFHLRLIFLLYA